MSLSNEAKVQIDTMRAVQKSDDVNDSKSIVNYFGKNLLNNRVTYNIEINSCFCERNKIITK